MSGSMNTRITLNIIQHPLITSQYGCCRISQLQRYLRCSHFSIFVYTRCRSIDYQRECVFWCDGSGRPFNLRQNVLFILDTMCEYLWARFVGRWPLNGQRIRKTTRFYDFGTTHMGVRVHSNILQEYMLVQLRFFLVCITRRCEMNAWHTIHRKYMCILGLCLGVYLYIFNAPDCQPYTNSTYLTKFYNKYLL